jgi:dolichol-phosphate mannosyltransferase
LSASLTIVVPTYREVESIPHLVTRLAAVREKSGLDLELFFMDDDSQDGSEQLVESLGLPWVKMIIRKSDRGLSKAVLEGLMLSQREMLVVMDADLSHPPETIPAMVSALETGADAVVGSRFAEGGSTADDWGVLRWLNSRVATLLALPLTMRRTTVLAGKDFDPIGYKILLELIIKCRCRMVVEVPIHFEDRLYGQSKLSFREQLRYIKHLRRLYIYKYGTWSHFAQFLCVGVSGLLINLLALTVLLRMNVGEKPAVGVAIVISMIWNFVLNRRFSFSYARGQSIVKQFFGFVAACAVGAVVNYFTTINVWQLTQYKQVAAVIGVLAGTMFNFVASRFVVFRSKHIRK